jgi:hypothetical protein
MKLRLRHLPRASFRFAAILSAASLVALVGCGDASRATVTGKVTADGQPVTGGSLSFAPVEGNAKPASAAVGSDGTYDLSDSEGAPIGKNLLLYSPPPRAFPEGFSPQPGDMPPASPYDGLKPSVSEVDIQGGANTLDVELVK